MKKTFLDDDLNDEIYMKSKFLVLEKQANLVWKNLWFKTISKGMVWKIHSRGWETRVYAGLIWSHSPNNNKDDKITIFTVFLDDIIIIRNNHETLASLKRYLIAEFD